MSRQPTTTLADYLTPEAAVAELRAAGLKVSVSTLYSLVGRIPTHKPPGMGLLFRRDDLVLWIEKHRREPKRREVKPEPTPARASTGTPAACPSGDKPVAFGLPSEELRRKAGIKSVH